MQFKKSEAPPELIAAINRIEVQADECYRSLALLNRPWNLAAWAAMVTTSGYIERRIQELPEGNPIVDAVLINLGISTTVSIRWAKKHGKSVSRIANRAWGERLGTQSAFSVGVAHQYLTFMTCLPMWHKDRYLAELPSPSLVRFTVAGGARERQTSAYQKSFRPSEGQFHSPRPQKEALPPEIQRLFGDLLERCQRKGWGFRCDPPPWKLWRAMFPLYQVRAAAAVRRPDMLSLGDYTLGDFKQFYAALMAICAAHEFFCFLWTRKHGIYPYESAVMIHSNSTWRDNLSSLSCVAPGICAKIIKDLTLGGDLWSDLHLHPFVALDDTGYELAVAPQFPLHSNLDDNILRVCSKHRPEVFDAATLEKEVTMRSSLQTQCPQFDFHGPLSLTNPVPDIDLVVTDEANSTIAIIELKWIRKPFAPFERFQRDEDVLKGFRQLKRIRDFLTEKPAYLSMYRGLPRHVDAYAHVHYLVVARDHWPWAEPDAGIALVDFNAFSQALSRSKNLNNAIAQLLTYDWLPVESRDFTVQYERSGVNGVFIESEIFISH